MKCHTRLSQANRITPKNPSQKHARLLKIVAAQYRQRQLRVARCQEQCPTSAGEDWKNMVTLCMKCTMFDSELKCSPRCSLFIGVVRFFGALVGFFGWVVSLCPWLFLCSCGLGGGEKKNEGVFFAKQVEKFSVLRSGFGTGFGWDCQHRP